MALFARSMELGGVDHSGFFQEDTSNNIDTTYGIRATSYVSSSAATDWLGVENLDGGPFSGAEFWHRGFFRSVGVPTAKTWYEYRSGGIGVFRLQTTASNVAQFQYWDGDSWENVGDSFALSSNTNYKFDLRILPGTGFEFYLGTNMSIEPSLIMSGSASMPLVDDIDGIRNYNTSGNTNQSARQQEWIWGDEPTVGHRYAWKAPNGNGTHTAGSGAFGDVDEAITTDTDVSTLAANGDAETYTHAAMGLPSVGTVKRVQLEARVRKVAGGAQNVKGRIRVGGVDYDQASNFAGIDAVYKPYVPQWATNPAGGDWTLTTAGQTSNEFGLLAQT